jgi:hypothetical protein
LGEWNFSFVSEFQYTLTAQRHLKEIGTRKILGSTDPGIASSFKGLYADRPLIEMKE